MMLHWLQARSLLQLLHDTAPRDGEPRVAVAGVSMGGHMAALTACVPGPPLRLCALLASHCACAPLSTATVCPWALTSSSRPPIPGRRGSQRRRATR